MSRPSIKAMEGHQPFDVFFYEAFSEEEARLRKHMSGHLRAGYSNYTIQEAGHVCPPAKLISVRTQSVIPLEWAADLTGVLSRTTGYDTVRAYRDTGGSVACGYLPLYCTDAVAEQALLLILGLLRKLPQQMSQFCVFDRNRLTGRECSGRKVLVVGVGNIGHRISVLALNIGMEVRGVDIVRRHSDITYVNAAEGIAWADIIVCAMNLTQENVGYFNYEMLRNARHGSMFVNVARGEMSPSDGLLRLLEEGHLSGVALDVFDDEQELSVNLRSGRGSASSQVRAAVELSKRKDVILTPHNSFNTEEAVERKAQQSAQQVEHFLLTDRFIWPIPE